MLAAYTGISKTEWLRKGLSLLLPLEHKGTHTFLWSGSLSDLPHSNLFCLIKLWPSIPLIRSLSSLKPASMGSDRLGICRFQCLGIRKRDDRDFRFWFSPWNFIFHLRQFWTTCSTSHTGSKWRRLRWASYYSWETDQSWLNYSGFSRYVNSWGSLKSSWEPLGGETALIPSCTRIKSSHHSSHF